MPTPESGVWPATWRWRQFRWTLLAAALLLGAAEPPGTVTAPAAVQAFFATDLYAKDSGYASHIDADIGDHVKQGQVLAVIDDPEMAASYDKARAAVLQAQAALEVAKRQFVGLQADQALQHVTVRRQRELFAGKAATAQALDDANGKEQASQANTETGRARIAAAQADLQVAEAEAQRLKALVGYDTITAPFNGVVTRRLVNPGDLVQTATSTRGAPLFTVQELDMVRVFADVAEEGAANIRPGRPATVTLYQAGRLAVHGTVTRVASAFDPATRTMRIEIDLPNPDLTLLPGMYAQVIFEPEAVNATR
jgi:multidrug efflux pump subunit AcrA (membrane-fusion protein)